MHIIHEGGNLAGFTVACIASMLLSGLLSACAYHPSSNATWVNFGQQPPQRHVNTITQRLMATRLPVSELGSVRYAEQHFPLLMVKVQRIAKQPAVCIFAGVHGNELAGTAAALSLLEDLAKDNTLYPRTNFIMMPLVNPWGWERGFRYNAQGQDIARHFALEGTQETALIKPLLAAEHCQLVIDLHEDSNKTGFYLLNYAHPDSSFTPKLVQAVAKELGLPAAEQVPNGVYQIAAEEFATNSRPTLAQYARQQGIEQAYIIETPMQLPFQQRIAIHRTVLDKLINKTP